jgi:hypothetical protein
MKWDFVSRAEQIEYVRQAVISRASGTIVVTGEPGMGRTTFLACCLDCADPERDQIVLLNPSRGAPHATLRADCLPSLPGSATTREVVEALARRAAGRRLIVAADDAHLMDYSSLLALGGLVRRGLALLLLTRPLVTSRLNRPDPTSCLAHDRDTKTIILLPMSVGEVASVLAGVIGGPVPSSTAEAMHAATGGNPGLLRALVAGSQVAEAKSTPGGHGADDMTRPSKDLPVIRADYPGTGQLVRATWKAWRELTLDRTDRLCRLGLQCGAAEEIAPIWAMLLLLRGQVSQCTAFLESLDAQRRMSPRLAMVGALALALGLGQPDEASELLLASAGQDGKPIEFLLALRAWILAVCGREAMVADALAALSRGDRTTALFFHAAKAMLAELRDQRTESVFHLRRAIASADTSSDDHPWIRPYLQASLIDALLLCGRTKEAVSAAQRFHANEPSSGWDIAVSIDTLVKMRRPPPGQDGAPIHNPVWCMCRSAGGSQYYHQACARSRTPGCDISRAR